MKKSTLAMAGILMVMSMLAGCRGGNAEKADSDLVKVQEESDTSEIIVDEIAENNEAADGTEETADELSAEELEKVLKEVKEAARAALLEEEKRMIDTAVPLNEGTHVAVVSKSTDGEFWGLVKQGMEDAVKAVNEAYGFEKSAQITMNFEGAEDELDVETQVNTIDAVIAENPDVLCISAGDMDSCVAQLEAARENGIPVVVFDSNVSEADMIAAYRATDNLEVGRMAAQKLAEYLGETGALAIFSAPEMTESGKKRVEGFRQELENYPDMEIMEIIYQDQTEDMKSAMQSTIAEYPELKGIFCTNATAAEIYHELNGTMVNQNLVMVGVDATTLQQEALREGRQMGIISQNPHMMGFETIWTALLASVDPETEVELIKNKLLQPVWIDLESINDAGYGEYLY